MSYYRFPIYTGAGGEPLGSRDMDVFVREDVLCNNRRVDSAIEYFNSYHCISADEKFYLADNTHMERIELDTAALLWLSGRHQLYPELQ